MYIPPHNSENKTHPPILPGENGVFVTSLRPLCARLSGDRLRPTLAPPCSFRRDSRARARPHGLAAFATVTALHAPATA